MSIFTNQEGSYNGLQYLRIYHTRKPNPGFIYFSIEQNAITVRRNIPIELVMKMNHYFLWKCYDEKVEEFIKKNIMIKRINLIKKILNGM